MLKTLGFVARTSLEQGQQARIKTTPNVDGTSMLLNNHFPKILGTMYQGNKI
jgi:hypothetical protein